MVPVKRIRVMFILRTITDDELLILGEFVFFYISLKMYLYTIFENTYMY